MVSSDNFGKLIGRLVAKNRAKLISFMRSQGISISTSANNDQVIESLFSAMKSTKFKDDFLTYVKVKSEESSNMQGSEISANGGFDPMSVQGGGQEFDAMSSQQGAFLNNGDFSNADGDFSNAGGFWDGFNVNTITDLLGTGAGLYGVDQAGKTTRAIENAKLEAKKLELELAREQGKITQSQLEAQLQLATLGKNAPKSTVTLWIIGGVVLLGALGTTIYFATRKK